MTARNNVSGRAPRLSRGRGDPIVMHPPGVEAAEPSPGSVFADVPAPRPNPQLDFELALMDALGLEGRNDVIRMTLDVQAGAATATVVLAAPVLNRAALAGELPPIIMRFKLVPVGEV